MQCCEVKSYPDSPSLHEDGSPRPGVAFDRTKARRTRLMKKWIIPAVSIAAAVALYINSQRPEALFDSTPSDMLARLNPP